MVRSRVLREILLKVSKDAWCTRKRLLSLQTRRAREPTLEGGGVQRVTLVLWYVLYMAVSFVLSRR